MIKRVLAGIMVSVVLISGSLSVNAKEPQADMEMGEEIQIPETGEPALTEESAPEEKEITGDEASGNEEPGIEDKGEPEEEISEVQPEEDGEPAGEENKADEGLETEGPQDEIQEERSSELYASMSVRAQSFSTVNLRSSETIYFEKAGGKVQVLIFGGMGSCGYTNEMLRCFDKVLEDIDLNSLNIYAFDIKNNSADTILSAVNGKSDAIQAGETNSGVSSIYQSCLREVGISSFTMPFVVYLDPDGDIYSYSTGTTSMNDICKRLADGGIEISRDLVYQQFRITGYTSYSYAYKILDLLNQERRKEGLTDLQMDAELLDAAMQRAAECSVYYDHQRPNGERCFTISKRMNRENIAMGYPSPESVMNGWMNSPGHHTNIMAKENASVGIGCVRVGNTWCWTQCFGSVTAVAAARPGDQNKTYTVETDDSITASLQSTSGKINEGETIALKVITASDTGRVIAENDSYQWSSSKTGVAAVDKNGVISGKTAGTAVITGINTGNPAKTLTYTVTVEKKKVTGWQKTGGIWYYFDADGIKQTGWQKVGGKWYYLNSKGEMQLGWCKTGGKWYYLDGSGVMQTGWQKISGKWYYLDGSGAMQTGWLKISGKWYYLDGSGAMQAGWQKISGKWYYLDGSGVMQTGWLKISGKWYYLDGGGVMQTGWLKQGSRWYYLKTDGSMVNTDTYINGKRNRFNGDGVWLGVG